MATIFGLIFFWWLLSGFSSEPKCPPLHDETKPIYALEGSKEYNAWLVEQEPVEFSVEGGTTTYAYMASTSLSCDIKTSKCVNLGTEIGEEPDLEAIEHNKKVKECQIINEEVL